MVIILKIESNIENEKQKVNSSDWFNFGLDEEKWIKVLNKSILMHYERHLIQQVASQEMGKMQPLPTNMNVRPNAPYPMAGYNPYMHQMYRPNFMPYQYHPSMMGHLEEKK